MPFAGRTLPVCAALLAALAPASPPPASEPQRAFVHAVEFPYYLYPRHLWERELVWMKTIGIRTVEFSIPWSWHETEPGEFDFTGATSPRRDLVGLIRAMRRLGLRGWVRPLPPRDRRAQRQWAGELERILAPQLERHGGPVAFVEGALPWTDHDAAPPGPPLPVAALSANDPAAMARSRQALAAGRGSLLWQDVEDAIYPAGWGATGDVRFRRGAVSLNGDERPTVGALRRDAALLQHWAGLITPLAARPLSMKLPRGVTAVELRARAAAASVVSIVNASAQPFTGDLRAWDRMGRRAILLPHVQVPAGDSLWLPIELPLAGGLCQECSAFANGEYIVYATAELQVVEFENGILAMEFAAPNAGEVVVQLSRRPSGPFLAGGKPTDFDWDEKTLRARLPIPAGKGAGSRVRIGLAIEPPENSAFFVEARRLIIGQKNLVSTSYSSAQLAARSRLRLPENFTARPAVKSPVEIDYEIDVPREALHGSWANLGIEADGVPLGRARLQLFRPVSVRIADALKLHFGEEELTADPAVLSLDPKTARNLDVNLRNNSPQIRTFVVEAQAEGWEFMPARAEISIGGVMERAVSLRAFAKEDAAGICEGRLKISGGAQLEVPFRIASIPRGQTAVYAMDLDGDGLPEWVLESARARAVFSTQDGGRWLEFVWKDAGANFLPEQGALGGAGAVEAHKLPGAVEFTAGTWKRTVRLSDSTLTVEQTAPLPAEALRTGKRDGVTLRVERPSARRAIYSLER